MVRAHCTDCDERPEEGNEHFVPAPKHCFDAEPKKEMETHCHGRRFRVWMWEQAVGQCLGGEWVKLAQNNEMWRSRMEEMIDWKKRKMVDRTCVQIQ